MVSPGVWVLGEVGSSAEDETKGLWQARQTLYLWSFLPFFFFLAGREVVVAAGV